MNRIRFVTGSLILVAGVMTGWSQETANPGFDHDLSGWSVGSVPRHQWSPVDAYGSVDSGSLLAFKDYPATNLVRAQQCVLVEPGAELNFMVQALVLGTGDPADVYVDLTPYADASCQSSTGLIRVSQTPPQDQWTRIVNGPYQVESGVQSVEVGLGLYEASGSTVPVSVHFDDAQFFLFIGDFETGTCSGWSASQPFCGTPEVGLRAEITWETSGDPDPGDGVGADLDMHLLHPNAAGAWLGPFDCYKSNVNPDWGAAGPEEDPQLIIQDDDGAGPEAIQISGPESVEYEIGVHYANDLGFGTSDATVRVWIDGSLVYEYPDKALQIGQFWSLGTVAWPSGTFTVEDTVSSGIP